MTVVTGWDLFEDMRDAQDELLRFNRLRAQGLGQFGQYYGGGTAKAAWAPALDITERKDAYLASGTTRTTPPRKWSIESSAATAASSARSLCPPMSWRMRSRPRRRTACCRSWCPRRRRYRPNVSRYTPARNTPTRHQPSRAKPATDNAPTQGTDVSRRHRWTEPWRRESHAQAPAAGDSSRVRWAAATAMRCVPPRAAGYRRL